MDEGTEENGGTCASFHAWRCDRLSSSLVGDFVVVPLCWLFFMFTTGDTGGRLNVDRMWLTLLFVLLT